MGHVNPVAEEFINYRPALVTYVVGILKSARDAEDIVQETYVRLVQSRTREKVLFPKAYLFRVARNVTLDHLRQKKREDLGLVSLKSEANLTQGASGLEEWLIADERLALLREAILNLPRRCQQVYSLRKVYGMSHREIATELSISVRTVENHIAAATAHCRRYVSERTPDVGKPAVSSEPTLHGGE